VVEAPAQGRFWRRGPSKRARAPPQPPNGPPPAASAATPTSEHQQQGDVLQALFLSLLSLLLLLSLAVLLSCAGEGARGGAVA
jgi:hypothetical protein